MNDFYIKLKYIKPKKVNMEITVEEWYSPSIDALGTYIDGITKTDVKCPCGARKKRIQNKNLLLIRKHNVIKNGWLP